MTELDFERGKKFRNGIARRFILYILLFSSVITLISTSYSLYLDYIRDVGTIQNNMRQIELSYLDSIVSSLWVTDKELLEIQVKGILQLPDMQYLEIRKNGEQIFFAGTVKQSNSIHKEFDLSFSYKGKDVFLGTLTVVANLDRVYQRLLGKVVFVLLTQSIKTFLVSFFVFFLFYYLVGQHLSLLGNYFADFDLSRLDIKLGLNRHKPIKTGHDELDMLVSGINQMRLNLVQDMTRRKLAEEELKKSEDRYRLLFQNASEAICIAQDGKVVFLNQMMSTILGYTEAEILERQFIEFIHPQDRELVFDRHTRRLQGEEITNKYLFRIIRQDNALRWLEMNTVLVDWGGKEGTLNFLNDTTERKQVEEQLRHSETALKKGQQLAHVGSWTWDIQSDHLEWSDEMYRIFEINKEDFNGRLEEAVAQRIHPDDRAEFELSNLSALENLKPIPAEYRVVLPDGTIRTVWVETGHLILNSFGKPATLTGIIQDITERKEVEEQVKASLREKETLLQEIHHRVKNNIQVISSLLALQGNSIEDSRIKEALKDSQSRVYTMSAVHETLYSSENLSEIDIRSYLSKITGALIQTYSVNPGRIELNTESDDIKLSMKQASPIGLIVNELVSNSLKYAFPGERVGLIDVTVKKLSDINLDLIISDNGIGIPKDVDWKNSNTLGLKLVRTLVENQLDGSIDMVSTEGTKFIIRINLET